MFERWIARPITVIAALLMIVALAAFFLQRLVIGPAAQTQAAWDVVIEHFGLDPEEIERSITNPLEEALATVGGLAEIRSVTEAGKSRVSVRAKPGTDQNVCYLGIRDAVDRVWRQLPRSVQKPQIISSGLRQSPVFIVALRADGRSENELRQWVDRNLKTEFEKIKGSGEVEVGGGEIAEIHVRLDEARATIRGITGNQVAAALQSQHLLASGGSLVEGGQRTNLVVEGRFASTEALGELRLQNRDGASVRLADIAAIERAGREQDTISRVDNERRVTVHVLAGGNANLIQLSRDLRRLCADLPARGLAATIVQDSGKLMEDSVNNLIWALIEGMLIVVLLLPFFLDSLRQVAGIAITLPLVVLFSLAGLAALGISVDRFVLAGIAVGLGNILDTFIIIAEQPDLRRFRQVMPALVVSTLTILTVLIPLWFIDIGGQGIQDISQAIALLIVVSLVLGAVFVPFLCGLSVISPSTHEHADAATPGWLRNLKNRLSRQLDRPWRRAMGRVVLLSARFPWAVIALALGLFAVVAWRTLSLGGDFGDANGEPNIYVHVECAPEATVVDVDQRIQALGTLFSAQPGVTMVESLSRQGNAQMTVGFNPALTDRATLAASLRQIGKGQRGVFVYLPESGLKDELALELAISGDDDARLRDLAQETARRLEKMPWVNQVVLNFKEAPQALIVRIDPERSAIAGQSAQSVASLLRWSLSGPVAIKWLDHGTGRDRDTLHEMDLRIQGQHAALDRQGLMQIPLASAKGQESGLRISSLAQLEEVQSGAKIYHKNRQRVVFLTVHCQVPSVETAHGLLWAAMSSQKLPDGYAFELDRRAVELESSFRLLWAVLLVGLVLIYLILAAQSQSFSSPLAVLSVIPVAAAVPLGIYGLSSQALTLPVVFGLIILAGVAVNTSILVSDRYRALGTGSPRKSYCAIRHCSRALVVTVLATLAGSTPLLFAQGGGNSFLGALSLIIMWGVAASFIATITIIPALLSLFPKLVKESL